MLRILSIFWGSFQITTMRKSLLCDGSMSSQCKNVLMLLDHVRLVLIDADSRGGESEASPEATAVLYSTISDIHQAWPLAWDGERFRGLP